MKNIKTSYISDPAIQQPFTGLSLAFLQSASKEVVGAVVRSILDSKGIVYDTTIPYLIGETAEGAVTLGVGYAYYFGGEIYIATGGIATKDRCVLSTAADATADPLLFSDSVNRDVHDNRTVAHTTTGTALFMLSTVVNARVQYKLDATMTNSWTDTSANAAYSFVNKSRVCFEGTVSKTGSGTLSMFTLPVAFRPSVGRVVSVVATETGNTVIKALSIASSGVVSLPDGSGTLDTTVYLDGASFNL